MIGRTLGGYRIVEQIGMGGMATVYKAYDASTDRYVALKTLPQQYSQDPQFLERFRREARAIARLEHLHILPVHAYGEEDGIAYLVMRYLPAGTLADRIRQNGHLPLDETARLVNQIASALDHAHANGVLHRDVKPGNVLIDRDGNAYLTDFGIARIVEGTLDLTGDAVLGTPQYMSPEQCRGAKDLTPATDQYSLGVVLYEMVTGRTPFQAETPLAVIHMQMMGAALPPPRSLRPELPEAAEAAILKALDREPERRYPSCLALALAFEAAVRELPETVKSPANGDQPTVKMDTPITKPSAAPPVPAVEAAPRRLPWAIIGGIAALVVIIGGALLLSSRPAEPAGTPVAEGAGTLDAMMLTATALIVQATQNALITPTFDPLFLTATAVIEQTTLDALGTARSRQVLDVENTATALAATLDAQATRVVEGTATAAAAWLQATTAARESADLAATETARAGATLTAQAEGTAAARPAAEAIALIEQGDRAVENYDFEAAIESYTGALERAPGSLDALVKRAEVFHASGAYDDALADYDRAVELSPDDAALYLQRGIVQRDKGDYGAARADYDRALERDPNMSWAYLERGKLASWTGQTQAALEDFNRAVERDPELGYAYFERGLVYLYHLHDYPAALDDLNRAAERLPDDVWVLRGRADVFMMAFDAGQQLTDGDLERALVDANRAIERGPEDPASYVQRGQIYGRLGDNDAALADFGQAIELAPEMVEAYVQRGWLLIGSGETEAALADLNRAAELGPDYAEVFHARGIAYRDAGDYERAAADLSRAIELAGDEPALYLDRGVTYSWMGENEPALADLGRALELRPDWVQAYIERGYVRRGMELYELAREDFHRVIELAPERPDGYRGLAELYLYMADTAQPVSPAVRQEGLASARRLVELTPDDSYAHLLLGMIYRRRGSPDRAFESFTRAIERDRDNGQAYFERAEVQVLQRRFRLALADYEQAAQRGVDDVRLYVGRARAHAGLGEFPPAVENLNHAIKLTPWDAELYAMRARVRVMAGDYIRALRDYSSAIVRDADRFNLEGVIADYQASIPEQADRAEAYLALADTLYDIGQLEPALRIYRAYVELAGRRELPPHVRQRIAELSR